jgi:hypothetical protein
MRLTPLFQYFCLCAAILLTVGCGGGGGTKSVSTQQGNMDLTIVSHRPFIAQVDVDENSTIDVEFNADIAVSNISVVLELQGTAGIIDGSLVLNSTGFVFSPSEPLSPNNTYRVTVNYGSSPETSKTYTWSFSTIKSEIPVETNAGSFHPSIIKQGKTKFSIIPIESVKPQELTKVSFGIPFPKSFLNSIAEFKLFDESNNEIAIAAKEVLSWRYINEDKKSVRSALVQVELVFESNEFGILKPRELTLEWGVTRTVSNLPIEPARASWVLVDDKGFSASDGIYEPKAYAIFEPKWYGDSVIKTRLLPINSHSDFSAYDTAFQLFGDTAINHVDQRVIDGNLIPYRESYAAWLFDRAMAIYQLAFRTGKFKYIRAAHRASQFYLQHINDNGYFSLKSSEDMKYSYGESLVSNYILLGDDRIPPTITRMINAWNSFNTKYTLTSNFWTERHAAFQLLGYISAYELFGNEQYKEKAQSTFNILREMQLTPDQGLPITGALMHTAESHGEGGSFIIASPWMSALLIDALERYYINFEEQEVKDFVFKMADFFKKENISLYEWNGWDGKANYFVPRYLVSLDNLGDYGGDNDAEHTLDVSKIFALAYYFSCENSECNEEYRDINYKLDQTSTTYTLPKWIRPAAPESGLSSYRLAPPRKFNWWYRISANNDFLQKGSLTPLVNSAEQPKIQIVQTVVHQGPYRTNDEILVKYSITNVSEIDVANVVVKANFLVKNPTNLITVIDKDDFGLVHTDGLVWYIESLPKNTDTIEFFYKVKVADFPILQESTRPVASLLFYANAFYCIAGDSEEDCLPWENQWSIGEHTQKTQSNWNLIEPTQPITPPTVNIISPSDQSVIKGSQVIIADVDDSDGVKIIELYMDDKLLSSMSEPPFEIPFQFDSLSEGEHFIKVDAWDFYGSKANASITISPLSPDKTPPVLNIANPLDGGKYCNLVEIDYQVEDDFGLSKCSIKFLGLKKELPTCENTTLSGIGPLFDAIAHFSFDGDGEQVVSANMDIKGQTLEVDRVSSPFTRGIEFLNDNSRVSFNDTELNIENNITVSFWLNPKFDAGVILSQGWSYIGVEHGWAISLGANNHENNNPMAITWSSGDSVNNLNQNNVIQTDANLIAFGEWQHVVVRKKDRLVDIFYNGELVTSKSLASEYIAWPYGATKGFSLSQPMIHETMYSKNYKGYLDEVSLWNKSLNNSDIVSLYNRTLLPGQQQIIIEADDTANNNTVETRDFSFVNCNN